MDLEIDPIIGIARRAGMAILEVYSREFTVEEKEDRSPLTEADKKANEIILEGLKDLHPDIPFITEEEKALPYSERASWKKFWLIDPLDGTKEFIKKNGEFTVNIALISGGIPVAGVVYQPAVDVLYHAVQGEGAWKTDADGNREELEAGPHYSDCDVVRVVASRSHMSPEVEAFVESLKEDGKEVELTSAGSSLKACLVAENSADVYPRLAPTMEWDIGAADAVARESGRKVLQFESREPLQYNKENLLNPWFIVE